MGSFLLDNLLTLGQLKTSFLDARLIADLVLFWGNDRFISILFYKRKKASSSHHNFASGIRKYGWEVKITMKWEPLELVPRWPSVSNLSKAALLYSVVAQKELFIITIIKAIFIVIIIIVHTHLHARLTCQPILFCHGFSVKIAIIVSVGDGLTSRNVLDLFLRG